MKSYASILAPLAVAFLITPTLSLRAQTNAKASGTPVVTPKVELFLGYTRFGTVTDQTVNGNRMVGVNGGSTSIAYNFNRYIGLVADFGGYDDSQLELTGNAANEPLTVGSSGTAYTYLFGPRLSYRNSTRFTPFGQILVGGVHASSVTISNCSGVVCTPLPAQTALAATAGGGLDIRLSRHFSIRAVQAEYMMTRFADVTYGSNGNATTQNDLRLSSGIVYGFGGKPPLPVQLACNVQPTTAFPGDPLTLTATATDLNPKRHASYSWKTSGGTLGSADAASTTIDTKGAAPGTYTVSGRVTQGNHPYEQSACNASFTIQPFAPPTTTCSANPSQVNAGDPVTITSQGTSPQNRALTYSYSATGGAISGNTSTATLNTAGAAPGDITVTCSVVDDLGKTASANTTVSVNAPPPPPAPQTRALCAVSFERDQKRPERVDNEAKGCLDNIALDMQRETSGRLVIVGNYSKDEKPAAAAKRTMNVRQYLVDEKGVEASRIDLRTGTDSGRTVTNVFVPEGATYNDAGTAPLESTMNYHREASKPHHQHK
ncbi:MAG: hypothetical protein HIU91_10915 [Acidobacteria bacterium]|nr:hypothetical protein [Acidobacteriota bacterium]